ADDVEVETGIARIESGGVDDGYVWLTVVQHDGKRIKVRAKDTTDKTKFLIVDDKGAETRVSVDKEFFKDRHFSLETTLVFRVAFALQMPILVKRGGASHWMICAKYFPEITDCSCSGRWQTVFPAKRLDDVALDDWKKFVLTASNAKAFLTHQAAKANRADAASVTDLDNLLDAIKTDNCVVASNLHNSEEGKHGQHFTIRVQGVAYHVYVSKGTLAPRAGNRPWCHESIADQYPHGLHLREITCSE
ncbi:unnamed protein product, partial [Symbiodinium sp. KB8]